MQAVLASPLRSESNRSAALARMTRPGPDMPLERSGKNSCSVCKGPAAVKADRGR
jgi:hypothetical protein